MGPIVLSAVPRAQPHSWELVTKTNLWAPLERHRIRNWVRCVGGGGLRWGRNQQSDIAPSLGESDAGELTEVGRKEIILK